MDPLSLSAAIVATLSLITDIYRLSQKIHQTFENDRKFRIIHFKLLVEKKKTVGWANSLRLVHGSDFWRTIAPENVAHVVEVLSEMRMTYYKADQKFGRFRLEGDKKASQSRSILSKIEWATKGYEEMAEIVKQMKAMNEALQILAPVLPPYSPPGTGRAGSGVNIPETYGTVPSDPVAEASATTSPGSPPLEDLVIEDPYLEPVISPITIQSLFSVCLDSLYVLGSANSTLYEPTQTTASHLMLWGLGLFEERLSLDFLISANPKRFAPLRRCLLRAFVNVAVTEEQMFRTLDKDLPQNMKHNCREAERRLTDLLGNDEVISMALERWQIRVSEDTECSTMVESIGFIARTVRSLFDLLSSIRSLRREHILITELSSKLGPQSLDIADPIRSEHTQAIHLIEDNIDAVRSLEEVFKEQEEQQQRQGKPVMRARKRIEKERERLEEWKAAAQESSISSLNANESKEVGKMQMELARALSAFSSIPGEKSMKNRLPGTQSTSSTTTSVQQKNLEFKTSGFVEELESLINNLSTATAHLYNTSPT